MNGQQLKNSILQLAIQGKLVPQDPNDEPASVLLGKIRKEKEQLVKAGKLKKKDLVCTPIADEEKAFEIPESWEWCKLGWLIKINSGDGLTSKDMKKGSFPVFGGNGITGFHDSFNVSKETVVIGRVGYYCGSVHVTPNKAWVTDNAFITQYPEQYIDRNFLVHCLRFLNLGRSNNATAQPVVSGKKIYPLLFPLPPLSEQHRIVSKIEELMPFVSEYDKAQSKLNELNDRLPSILKKSILQEAIMGKLVPQDPNDEPASALLSKIRKEKEQLVKAGKLKKKDLVSTPITDEEKPFEIPVGWEWCRLKNIFSMQAGKSIKADELSSNQDSIHKYKCYGGNGCRGFIAKKNHEGEFCIVGRQGALCGNVNLAKGEFYATEHAVVVTQFGNTSVKWAYYFLEACKLNQYATATAQPGLSVANIMETLIPLPPLSEQHRIVSKIEELFSVLE